ncbi:MAG: hypothetical protein ACYCSB_00005 [bacterium]
MTTVKKKFNRYIHIVDATHETEEFNKTPIYSSISEEAMSDHNKDYVSFWEKEFYKLNAVISIQTLSIVN